MTRWRHVRRGTCYEEIGTAEVQIADGQMIGEGAVLIIYRGDDGKLWARPINEFLDGRFEPVAGE